MEGRAFCGELSVKDVEREVRLAGWVHRRRDLGGLIFIDLRDRLGIVQLIFSPESQPLTAKAGSLQWRQQRKVGEVFKGAFLCRLKPTVSCARIL